MPVCLLYKVSHVTHCLGANHFRERGGVPNKLASECTGPIATNRQNLALDFLKHY